MNKRLLALLPFIIFATNSTLSIPSYPHYVRMAVGDGFRDLLLRGDEHFKYAMTETGYTLLPTEDGWYYATSDECGNTVCSTFKLSADDTSDDALQSFLHSTPKALKPSIAIEPLRLPERRVYEAAPRKSSAIGSRRVLVILMQFADREFKKDREDFNRLFNKEDYTEDGAVGSVLDYYHWASYGQLDLHSDVMGPYTARHEMAFYGGNSGYGGGDKNPYALFEEAMDEVTKEVNLSDYDADNDGYVDNIHIIYAGFGEEAGASSNAIWAHEMTFRPITVQGMKIDRYSCAPELRSNFGNGISRIGPHCHEIGHALGAMDYYDTNYETGGYYQGTGQWDIMASGSWNDDGISPADFNPYVKIYDFGWTEAQALEDNTINTIHPSSEKSNIFRIDTPTNGDYFLLENRNGESFHKAEPGKGLLVFHIGAQLEEKAQLNTINATFPQQCYVVCASSPYRHPTSNNQSYGNINSDGCPFPGSADMHEFGDNTVPAALDISGASTGISLSGIEWIGKDIGFLFGTETPPLPPDSTTTEPVSFWQEDFEQMKIPESWDYQDIIGMGDFSVVTKLSENGTPQSPPAASGKGYAKYGSTSRTIFGRYRTRGVLTTDDIVLAKERSYTLSLKLRRYARQKDACDTLSIVLTYGEETRRICDVEVSNQDAWTEATVSIPNHIGQLRIGIEANIDTGSILFVDEMKITEHYPVGIVDEHVVRRILPFLGMSYSQIGLTVPNNKRGVNIVRMSDGTYKKVVIK